MPKRSSGMIVHDDVSHTGTAKRDTNGGVAGLGAVGDVLAKSPRIQLQRDVGDFVYLRERTSGEDMMALYRSGANDYDAVVFEGGLMKQILTESFKGVANQLATLDAKAFLTPAQAYPFIESYDNHLGAVDNFTATATSTGTATADATNHLMALDSANGAGSYASFASKKAFTPGTKPIIANFIIQGLANGTGGNKLSYCGLVDGPTSISNMAAFHQKSDNAWVTRTMQAGTPTDNAIAALANGDQLTIVITSAKADFYKNGTLLFSHTTNLPLVGCYLETDALCTSAAGTSRTISIDYMSIKKFL